MESFLPGWKSVQAREEKLTAEEGAATAEAESLVVEEAVAKPVAEAAVRVDVEMLAPEATTNRPPNTLYKILSNTLPVQ